MALSDSAKLASLLRLAKQATQEKPLHFVFVPNRGQDGTLLLAKKKVPSFLINKAKLQNQSTKFYFGICFGERALLVFGVAKKVPATLAVRIKRAAKLHAKLSLRLEVRFLENVKLSVDDGAEAVAGAGENLLFDEENDEGSESVEDDVQDGWESVEKDVVERIKIVGPKLRDMLLLKDVVSSVEMKRLKLLAERLNAAVKDKDFVEASGLLDQVEALLADDDNESGEDDIDESWESIEDGVLDRVKESWKSIQEGVVARFKKVRQKTRQIVEGKDLFPGVDAVFVKHLARQLDVALQDEDYARASGLLDKLEPLLQEPSLEERNKTLEEQKKAYAKVYREQQGRLKVMLEQLLAKDRQHGEQLQKTLQGALEQAAKAKDSDKPEVRRKALERLEAVLETVQAGLDNTKWREQVDRSQFKKDKQIGDPSSNARVFLLKDTDGPGLVVKEFNQGREALLEKEARMYERIGDHPNIVRCLGVREVDGKKGLVMEALQGGSIGAARKLMQQQLQEGKIKQHDYWGVMQYSLLSMVKGLQHMHENGVVHLDIKPDNVLFDAETGTVKLIDVGGELKDKPVTEGVTIGWVSEEVFRLKDKTSNLGNVLATPELDAFTVGSTAFSIGDDVDDIDEQITGEMVGRKRKDKSKKGEEQQWLASQYGDFLKKLLDPDPKTRMKLDEAFEHPFLKDRLLPDEAARQVIQGLKGLKDTNQSNVPQKVSQQLEEARTQVRPNFKDVNAKENPVIRSYQKWMAGLSRTTTAFFDRVSLLKTELPNFDNSKYDIDAYERYSRLFTQSESALRSFQARLPQLGKDALARFTELEEVLKGNREKLEALQIARDDVKKVIKQLVGAGEGIPELLKKLQAARDRISAVLSSPGAAALRRLPAHHQEAARCNSMLDAFGTGANHAFSIFPDYQTVFSTGAERLAKAKQELSDAEVKLEKLKSDKVQAVLLKTLTEARKSIEAVLGRLEKALDRIPLLVSKAGQWIEAEIQSAASAIDRVKKVLDGAEKDKEPSVKTCVQQYPVLAKTQVEAGKFIDLLKKAEIEINDASNTQLGDDKVLGKRLEAVVDRRLAVVKLRDRVRQRLAVLRECKAGIEAASSLAKAGELFTLQECTANGTARQEQVTSLQDERKNLNLLDEGEVSSFQQRVKALADLAQKELDRARKIRDHLLKNPPAMLNVVEKWHYPDLLKRLAQVEIPSLEEHVKQLGAVRKVEIGEN